MNIVKNAQTIPSRADLPGVDPALLHHRAVELAMNHGRSADELIDDDWQRAMRELVGLKVESAEEARWLDRFNRQ